MIYQIEVSPKAEEEAHEILRWLARHTPKKLARWQHDFAEKAQSLERFPARCPLAPESQTFDLPIRHLIFGKYRILFTIENQTVFVLHVRHVAQQTLSPEQDEF